MSSQLQVTGEAKIRDIQGPVVANSGVITALDGAASQYVRGDGTLANFPTSGGGGGGSVSYYLNGSVNQGNINGSVYYQMSKTPVIGAGTNFSIANNDLIAQFITDANDPSLLEIPAGNWNLEMYFSASSSGGNPSFYVELYKYNTVGGFTLISSSSATPEGITNGTTIDLYTTALAVPSTALTVTDRIMLRVFVNNSGRTITLHTENSHLCQVITTFSTGITALNGLTKQVQYLAVGTSGTDFNIVSSGSTHTFNIPSADGSNRGLVTTGTQSFGGNKSFGGTTTAANLNVSGVLTVFGNLSNGTYSYTLPSAAGQLALTSQIPSISGTSYILSRFNLAGTSLENSSISDTGTYTGSPTGQVTINSRLAVNNFTELNRYLSIAQNPDQTWVPPTTGVNIELFFNSVTGIPSYAPDSAYIRARKASDDSLKRLFVLGSELILNQNTSGKTLINKQGAIQTTTKLEVAGYARFDNSINVIGAVYLNATDASQDTYFQAPSGNFSLVTSGTILLRSGANTGVYVANTGFVGINGATPTVALTVSGDGSFTTDDNNFAFNLKLRNTNTGTQALTGLGLSDSADTRKGQVLWIPSNYVTASLQNSFLVSSVTNVPLILCADATGADTPNIIFQSGATNKMLLNGTTGNFSIGNTNNTYKLDVSGTGRFTGALTGTSATFSSSVTANGTGGVPALNVRASDTNFALASIFGNQAGDVNWLLMSGYPNAGDFTIRQSDVVNALIIKKTTGAATFSSSVTAGQLIVSAPATTSYGSLNAITSGYAYQEYKYNGNAYGYIGQQSSFISGASNTDLGIVSVNNLIFGTSGSFNERMRITSTGNVGIGTSSPINSGGYATLTIGGNSTIKGQLTFNSSTTPVGYLYNDATNMNIGSENALIFQTTSSATERMRITSGGRVTIGSTTALGKLNSFSTEFALPAMWCSSNWSGDTGYTAMRIDKFDNNSSTSQIFINFSVGNNSVANGQINGNGSGAVAFGSWSDKRLKENIVDLEPQLNNILSLRPVEFDYIESEGGGHQTGFIAQEMQEVYPDSVGERLDGMLTISGWSKTEARLVKAIQEQQAQIEELKALINK